MLQLPFTTDQFLELFKTYNQAIWPAQIIAYGLGLLALVMVLYKNSNSDKTVAAILGLFWLWTGIGYHIMFFSEINQAAYLFGSLFAFQGLLFLFAGVFQDKLMFRYRNNLFGIIGGLFILYALLIYPLIGSLMGHGYPQAPVFGVAPCPMTIFTFGLLLWTENKIPLWLLIIPVLWSIIGFTAAFKLGIIEDTGLIVAGISTFVFLIYRNRKYRAGVPVS